MATNFNDNDNTLFIKLGKGSQKDLMAVLERYFSPLLHYISRVVLNREIAKEIVMDAMEILWENRISVATMEKPYSWLQKCAFNGALKYLKIKSKNAFVVPLKEDFNPPAADKLEYGLEAKEFSDRIVLVDRSIASPAKRDHPVKNLRQPDQEANRKTVAYIGKLR